MSESVTYKACRTCRKSFTLDDFYVHPQMNDGHLNICKSCVKSRVKARERYLREQDPEWLEQERARSRRKALGQMTRYIPAHRKANTAVSNAIRDGRLIPSPVCELCGHDFSTFRREAHHKSYEPEQWLVVTWLCSFCHGKQHRDDLRLTGKESH